jgi:hypothetical protein
LKKLNTGYKENTTKIKVSHLLYMDDWKLTGRMEEELQNQRQGIRTFSDDIHMEFGHDKSAKIVLNKGKLVHSHNLTLHFNTEIQQLKQGKIYMYLRIKESDAKQHQQMKERIEEGIHQKTMNDNEI